jgi:lipopolysaccharide biosynthesis glycosyltransferase
MNIVREKIIYGNKSANRDDFHIVFGIDDDFVRPLGVLMTSIIENNKNEKIVFHIISKYIGEENKKIIKYFSIKNNININIYIIDKDIFKNLPKTEYISHATYNRFLIPNILKDITDKVLYLDADIICLNSIKLLEKINIDDNVVGVVEEANKYVEKQQIKELKLKFNKYFNAGVMYINIKNWIKYDVNNKILSILKSKKNLCLMIKIY